MSKIGALSKVRNGVDTVVPGLTTLLSESTFWLLMPISPRRYQPEYSATGAAQPGEDAAKPLHGGGGGPRSAACAAGIARSTAAPAAASNRVLRIASSLHSRPRNGAANNNRRSRQCSPFVKWDLTLPFNQEY